MNKVELVGRPTKDPVLKQAGQTSVVNFSLAVKRRKEGADFISCKAFGKVAELMEQYVRKGHMIGVVGHIHTGTFEKEGVTIYTTDVVVDELEFLEKKAKTEQQEEQEEEYTPVDDIVDDDDLPF